jgi:hypothetical protein
MLSVFKPVITAGTAIPAQIIQTVLRLGLSVLIAASADLIQGTIQPLVLRQTIVQQTLACASTNFSTSAFVSTRSAYRLEVAAEVILAIRAPATLTAPPQEMYAPTACVQQQEAEAQTLALTPTIVSSQSILFALSVFVSVLMQSALRLPTSTSVPLTQAAALELHVKMAFVLTTPIALVPQIVSLISIFVFCRGFALVSMVFVDLLVMDLRRSVLLLRIVELSQGVV